MFTEPDNALNFNILHWYFSCYYLPNPMLTTSKNCFYETILTSGESEFSEEIGNSQFRYPSYLEPCMLYVWLLVMAIFFSNMLTLHTSDEEVSPNDDPRTSSGILRCSKEVGELSVSAFLTLRKLGNFLNVDCRWHLLLKDLTFCLFLMGNDRVNGKQVGSWASRRVTWW